MNAIACHIDNFLHLATRKPRSNMRTSPKPDQAACGKPHHAPSARLHSQQHLPALTQQTSRYCQPASQSRRSPVGVGALAGDCGLDGEAQERDHGQAAVLDLLHLQGVNIGRDWLGVMVRFFKKAVPHCGLAKSTKRRSARALSISKCPQASF
jgi:hypothetical protein